MSDPVPGLLGSEDGGMYVWLLMAEGYDAYVIGVFASAEAAFSQAAVPTDKWEPAGDHRFTFEPSEWGSPSLSVTRWPVVPDSDEPDSSVLKEGL